MAHKVITVAADRADCRRGSIRLGGSTAWVVRARLDLLVALSLACAVISVVLDDGMRLLAVSSVALVAAFFVARSTRTGIRNRHNPLANGTTRPEE